MTTKEAMSMVDTIYAMKQYDSAWFVGENLELSVSFDGKRYTLEVFYPKSATFTLFDAKSVVDYIKRKEWKNVFS